MTIQEGTVAYSATLEAPFGEAVERCREALADEGFGVLAEMDVQAALQKKLGVEREPFLILGACHPPSAHRALSAAPEVGVLLPCNVTVSREGGKTVVRAMNPKAALALLPGAEIAAVAREVDAALRRVMEKVAG